MIAIILAAGQGTRMRPLTETRLKGSLPILNEALLVRMADMIEKSGLLDKLVIVISPGQEDEMLGLFSQKVYFDKINIAIQDPPKGTADALVQAEQFLEDEDLCLVFNGDILAPLDDILPKLVSHHKKLNAVCTMVGFPGENERYGLMHISEDGFLLDIQEKVKENAKKIQGYINAGIYLFNKEIFDVIRRTPLSKRGEYEITDSIALYGKEGVLAAISTDSWISIEHPFDLFQAQKYAKPDEKSLCMQFHSGGEIGFKAAEDVFFEEGLKVDFSSIKITGPVLIGKGTLVKTNSVLGPYTYIGRDCEIGFNTILSNCLLMDNSKIGNDCTINAIIAGEELVVGNNANIQPIRSEPKGLDNLLVIGAKTIIGINVIISNSGKIEAHSVINKTKS
ncbi:MAG: hypothetical protein FK734_09535 [Asgard group archaeon]|nr:hypothetical protein [Asgard group archaeon]